MTGRNGRAFILCALTCAVVGTCGDAVEPGMQPAPDSGVSGIDAGRPYANVTAVSLAGGSEGAYVLAVTIESSDIDCSQFADWWEVLAPDGALIYRRILSHSHTDENGTTDPDAPGNTFTRTGGPVPIATSDEVIVRAHMSNGGYFGTAMQGSLDGGFSPAVEVGPEFASAVEAADPQPTECSF
jgi:hypothetical protein